MLTIDQIQQAIAKQGAKWRAENTEIFRRGLGSTADNMLGLTVTADDRLLMAESKDFEIAGPPPPTDVDWRQDPRNIVSPVKDQGLHCGACVAFATNAALESDAVISHGQELILSEGHLFHCNGGSCKNGWGVTSGLVAAKGGVGLEADLPWSPTSGCRNIAPVLAVTSFQAHTSIDARKRAVASAPVLAGLAIYEDFSAYRSGVYRHVAGSKRGNHAVSVVGYSDQESCWIAKNSWGPGFGEAGFFRIGYGECEIDGSFAFFSVETRIV